MMNPLIVGKTHFSFQDVPHFRTDPIVLREEFIVSRNVFAFQGLHTVHSSKRTASHNFRSCTRIKYSYRRILFEGQ